MLNMRNVIASLDFETNPYAGKNESKTARAATDKPKYSLVVLYLLAVLLITSWADLRTLSRADSISGRVVLLRSGPWTNCSA
jgi:hypothetical protein